MNKVILALMVLGTVFACETEDANPAKKRRAFFENAELRLSDNAGVYPIWTRGEKTIFQFAYVHPDDPLIADDELTEHFWLEIPANLEEFSVEGTLSAESDIEVYYTRSCFCYIPEAFEFSRLRVNGRKTAQNKWLVSFEMTAEGEFDTYKLSDSGTYRIDTFNWE